MKREIKFRGIREEYNPSWNQSIFKYGNLLNNNSIGEVGYDLAHYEYAKVKPETVGQFTGLKDKNGVECYEGDRLYDGEYEYIVVFEEGAFVAQNQIPTRRDGNVSQCEIIGNIYENKR